MLKGIVARLRTNIHTRLKTVLITSGVVTLAGIGAVAVPVTTHALDPSSFLSGGSLTGLLSSYGGNTSTCAIETVGWVVCPTMRSIAKLADYGFAFINQNFLRIEFNISSTSGGVYKAWELMRTIANALFVLAFMAIAYSQISGRGGGYNIKRMLPRLIIGAILVNLSYYVCEIGIEIVNIIGDSILSLMQGVTSRIGPSAMSLTSAANNFNDSRLSDITTAVLTKSGTVWILLAPVAAVTVAIAVICAAGLVLLIMRKVVISMLILVSPIVFVMYLLPNLEHYFQQWGRLFIQLLVLYPVIAFLLGTGQIISATIMNVGTGDTNTYHVADDAYFARNGGSGSVTTDLAASGAAVLPLLGVWFMMKSLTSFATTAGARVAGSIANRRSRSSEDKVKAKLEAKQAQPGGRQAGLPVYERKNNFTRRRRGAGVSSTVGADSSALAGKKPGTGGTPGGASLFDRMVGNVNGAGNVAAQNAQAEAEKKLEEINAAKIAEAQTALTGEGGDDKKKEKTAKDIFNNMNDAHHMKDDNPQNSGGGGNGGGGSSGEQGGGSKQVTPGTEYRAPTIMQNQGVKTSGPASGGVQQVVAVPVQVDASTFLNKQPTPGAGAMAAGANGSTQAPSNEIQKKANARAQRYIFDSQEEVEKADKELDKLNDIRRQLGSHNGDPRKKGK